MLMRRKAERQRKAVPKRKQRKIRKPGKRKPSPVRMRGKQKRNPAAVGKVRKAGRYPGMKCRSRNVPVKKNAHSIPLIKIVRSARGITAYANM